MMKSILILMTIFSINLLAQEEWFVDSVVYKLHRHSSGALINNICIKNPNCMAVLAIKNKTPMKILPGGKNPGSTACKEKDGIVFIAERKHTSQGFCRFRDNSFVSLSGFIP